MDVPTLGAYLGVLGLAKLANEDTI